MAKSISRTVTYDQPVEKVLSAVTSEEFQIAQRKTDAAVVEAEYREVRRTDQELLFEVHSVEYERGMTGLDKKKTVKSVMSSKWYLTKLTGTWTYTNEATDRFKLGGTDRLEEGRDFVHRGQGRGMSDESALLDFLFKARGAGESHQRLVSHSASVES